MRRLMLISSILFYSFSVNASECPPDFALCLSEQQRQTVLSAVMELKDIKESEAKLEFLEPIVVIRDWNGRVYVNGGSSKPIRMRLRLSTIERDFEATFPVQVYYREEPPDPPLRLRIRAQSGFLVPSIIDDVSNGGEVWKSLDAGIGWDFLHYDEFNLSLHTGIRSVGLGIGFDLTRNFGPYAGYSLEYDNLSSNAMFGVYFSFN